MANQRPEFPSFPFAIRNPPPSPWVSREFLPSKGTVMEKAEAFFSIKLREISTPSGRDSLRLGLALVTQGLPKMSRGLTRTHFRFPSIDETQKAIALLKRTIVSLRLDDLLDNLAYATFSEL